MGSKSFSAILAQSLVTVQFVISTSEFSLLLYIFFDFVAVCFGLQESASAFLSKDLSRERKFVKLDTVLVLPTFWSQVFWFQVLLVLSVGWPGIRDLSNVFLPFGANNSCLGILAYLTHVVFLGRIQFHFTSP